ncbi:MAG: hypothetical protein RLZZ200_2449 [Pseudomonadota bacterium]|jgi:5-(carboxyamino)imidazole ribonucleotide synthase
MTVGIVGAGQLGRMMALAGYPLGLDFLFLDKDAGTCAAQLSPQLTGAFDDPKLLDQLAKRCEVVTIDWENVPVASMERISGTTPVAPPLAALAAAQDRLSEKSLFRSLGIPTNDHMAVDSREDLIRATQAIGLPGVLKTRRMGYDGKGQAVLRKPADIEAAWAGIGGQPLIYEAFVPFDYEVSIIGVRSTRGEIALYPLNRNLHRDGILRLTRAPWHAPVVETAARRYMRKLLTHFNYVGVLAVEFFVRRGRLVANEMAPRVHNSGHWTIEGAVTSQFENHVRAILGLPLGDTTATGHSAMLNLIGEMPTREGLLADGRLHLHDYGKSPRPGRKLGHVTLLETTARKRDQRAAALLRKIDARKL